MVRWVCVWFVLGGLLAGCGESDRPSTPVQVDAGEPPVSGRLRCAISPRVFTAGGPVKNERDRPVTVLVVARWSRLGDRPVRTSERLRVPARSSREARIRVPVSREDFYANFAADGACSVDLRIGG